MVMTPRIGRGLRRVEAAHRRRRDPRARRLLDLPAPGPRRRAGQLDGRGGELGGRPRRSGLRDRRRDRDHGGRRRGRGRLRGALAALRRLDRRYAAARCGSCSRSSAVSGTSTPWPRSPAPRRRPVTRWPSPARAGGSRDVEAAGFRTFATSPVRTRDGAAAAGPDAAAAGRPASHGGRVRRELRRQGRPPARRRAPGAHPRLATRRRRPRRGRPRLGDRRGGARRPDRDGPGAGLRPARAARPRRRLRWPPCVPSTACRRTPTSTSSPAAWCCLRSRCRSAARTRRCPSRTAFAFRPGDRVPVAPARGAQDRVYVTLGTVFNTGSGDLFERLLAGVADLDADVW